MSRLTEKYVQNAAIKHLEEYYKNKCNPGKIICIKEAGVNYKGKTGRADGLIAFKSGEQKYFTASLEAKSHKTFKSLITQYKDIILFLIGILILCLVFILLFNLFNEYSWIVKIGISILASILAIFGVCGFIEKKGLLKKHGIIEQVKRYPANEKWIAFSKDAYNLNYSHINELKENAKRYGIGIIIVSSRKIYIELEAEGKRGNYLEFYSQRISNELNAN